ncbi:MAG: 50S ribosomal protein L11 methyltransferase [Spirochaetia bacterium]|nr:50S ribosomal protein L11 methyltransferase [Spirochaetia bacterium]
MTSSDSIYREVRVKLAVDDAVTLTRSLDESPIPEMAGYYELLYQEGVPGDGQTELVLFFPADDILAQSKIEMYAGAVGASISSLTESSIDRDAYLTAYKKHYKGFMISPRIAVIPSWERGGRRERVLLRAREGDPGPRKALYIDPGLAFGTGRHATTSLMIQRMEHVIQPGFRVVDAGTGSGILSVAALLLGAGEVYAFDIDSNAVRAASHNVSMNPTAGAFSAHEGGLDLLDRCGRADLVLANITAAILTLGMRHLQGVDAGRLLLSGILLGQETPIIDSLEKSGRWRLLYQQTDDGWLVLDFGRTV